jgi:hypothetical protein
MQSAPASKLRFFTRDLNLSPRWKYGGVEYLDDIIKVEVVSANDRTAKKFFKEFKERLKKSLKQIDILITTHGIQVI